MRYHEGGEVRMLGLNKTCKGSKGIYMAQVLALLAQGNHSRFYKDTTEQLPSKSKSLLPIPQGIRTQHFRVCLRKRRIKALIE